MSNDPLAGDDERPLKRSLTLQGHRTSVSLEAAFWTAFRAIATERGRSVNGLAAELDARRRPPASLASAIRVFVLRETQAQVGACRQSAPTGDPKDDAGQEPEP